MISGTTILGVVCRPVGPSTYEGQAAQIIVTADADRRRGWRVAAHDARTGDALAFGVGATLERAERDAQDDFVNRMSERLVAARRAA